MFIYVHLVLYVNMKRRLVHVFELRQYSDLSRHIEEPQNGIYCLNFFKNEAEGPETLFHIRSNLLCLLCRCVVSFLFALRYMFYCVRTWCVVWEWHCLSVMATVTKGGRVLRRSIAAICTIVFIAWVVHWHCSSMDDSNVLRCMCGCQSPHRWGYCTQESQILAYVLEYMTQIRIFTRYCHRNSK